MAPHLTFDEIAVDAVAVVKRRGLPPIYLKRLNFELSEIRKQGADQQWVERLLDENVRWDSNPNNLLLPWLFNRVNDDPISGRETDVVVTARYADVIKMTQKRGKLPAELTMDSDKPDIDIDCLPEARDEIKAHAVEMYSKGIDDGYGAVCSVSTWMTYLLRQAIQDTAKATGWIDKSEAIRLTKELPDEVDELKDNGASACKGKVRIGDEVKDCKTTHAFANCPNCNSPDTEGPTIGKLLIEQAALSEFYRRSAAHKDVIDYAVRLVGRIRAMGKHAGALIIADRPLYGNLPLYRRAKAGKKKNNDGEQWISIWTEGRNTQLSKFGYTKWDILGLKNLRYIYECCKMIEENHGVSFGPGHGFGDGGGWNDINPEDDRAGHYFDANHQEVKINLNDPMVLNLASESKTDAVFQFDTDLAKRTLSNGVRHFYDLVVLNSMGHPGPMAMIPDYIERRDDDKAKWKNDEHPEIARILAATHGTIVWQEQLQGLWQGIAGFTAVEAQEARKAVAKKWKDKLKPVEQKWLMGAEKLIGRKAAEEWWTKQITFGRYAFNKSHGVSYCLVAFRCLWLKAHFPHEWWASVMGYCNPDKLIRYMNVARGEGVEFRSVDVANLTTYFKAFVVPRVGHDGKSEGYIVPGLLGMKCIGESVCTVYAKPGQFNSIDEFVEQRGKHKILMERLIKLGAFKHLLDHDNSRATWIWYQYNHCTGQDVKKLKDEIDKAILLKQGWTEDAIVKERIRQEDEYTMLYPKRKKIPKKISNFIPKVNVSLAKIKELYQDDYNLADVLKFEEQFLGYTLHSPVDLFIIKGRRTIEDAKVDDDGELEAVIVETFKGKTKTNSPMMRLTVTDGIQTATLILWHDQFILVDQAIFRRGVGIRVRVRYDRLRGSFTLYRNCPIIRLRRRDQGRASGAADAQETQ